MTKHQQNLLLNRLGLAPVRTCKSVQHCCLCDRDITAGNDYRDAGKSKAHVVCFTEASKASKARK